MVVRRAWKMVVRLDMRVPVLELLQPLLVVVILLEWEWTQVPKEVAVAVVMLLWDMTSEGIC